MVYSPYQRGGESNASILREVPCQKGNERSKVYHDEERKAGFPGNMPHMWHQDVQDRESLKIKVLVAGKGCVSVVVPSLFIVD